MCSQLHKPRTSILLHAEQCESGIYNMLLGRKKKTDAASQLFRDIFMTTAQIHEISRKIAHAKRNRKSEEIHKF